MRFFLLPSSLSMRPNGPRSSWFARALVILSALALLGPGCTTRPSSSGADDDDDDSSASTGDDDDGDDTSPLDDDDTSAGDDDDSGGDDDDSGGDDDDSGGDGDFSLRALTFSADPMTVTPGTSGSDGVSALFIFSYWSDLDMTDHICDQRIQIEGTCTFGAGVVPSGCTYCIGYIEFDTDTLNDLSNPTLEPTDCDISELEAAGANFGVNFLTPITQGGAGDFLNLALMHSDTMAAEGLNAHAAGGDLTSQDLETTYSDIGLDFTHLAFIDLQPGTMSEGSSLDNIATSASPGSTWYAYFAVSRDSNVNSNGGAELAGQYRLASLWKVTFADPDAP